MPDNRWTLGPEQHQRPLDGVLRGLLGGVPWSKARDAIHGGKVRVNGAVVVDAARRLRRGDEIALDMAAPRPRVARVLALAGDVIVHLDAAVVVVDKPAGISTVPFDDEDDRDGTLDALVRDLVSRRERRARGGHVRAPLGVVHRLDKATSGLVVFARTVAAKKHLAQQFRVHTTHRRYLALAHGDVRAATFRTHLVEDRGDGLRGSVERSVRRSARRPVRKEGQLAVTHVEPLERLAGATLVACRLETGRTHQIRIHLAEAGHPLVGERVYVRELAEPIGAPRLMLHAFELGFVHPVDERPMRFRRDPPADFADVLERLRQLQTSDSASRSSKSSP